MLLLGFAVFLAANPAWQSMAAACEGSEVIFEDNFADDAGGWPLKDTVEVKDGLFVFKLPPDDMQSNLNVTFTVKDADICSETVWPNGEQPMLGAGLPLDSLFALNAAMPALHALYQRGDALIVHAVHSPYRGRSHFDGQDVLESGLAGVARVEDGWLNRALMQLPATGRANPRGLAIGAVVPLLMRGAAPALSWIPKVNDLPLRIGQRRAGRHEFRRDVVDHLRRNGRLRLARSGEQKHS